ncbi:MAG: hypothetical protein HW390_2544 [Candidatus Brocadiaceae bacterium]|nr:hypothetical protein [Candidatus Brocadiaceae bacterium]
MPKNDRFGARIAKVGLTSLLASTFLGGSGSYGDNPQSLAIDTSGNVYVTGITDSTDFPTTSGAYDTSYNGGFFDVFVTKLNSGLTSLLASTYLGGQGKDTSSFLSLDTSGNVCVMGYTESTNFPTTIGAYATLSGGGSYDVFVSKLDGNLSADISCTYSISPTSQSFSSSGGDGSVGVTASSSCCSWTAVSNAAWIAVTSGGSGAGDGTVAYSVLANTGTSARTGTMTIAGKTFTATQDGIVACKAKSITAAPKNLSLKKNGNGDVTITVKGAGNCLDEGATVTATISGNGNQIIDVSPVSQATDANGQAVFAIDAKDKKGTAAIRFRANGLSKSTTVKVKVR